MICSSRLKLFIVLVSMLVKFSKPQNARRQAHRPRQTMDNTRRGAADQQDASSFYKEQRRQESYFGASSSNQNFTMAYTSMFPLDPPKHVVEGVWNALKSAMMASGIGLLSIIGLPLALGKKSGVLGFLGGVILATIVGSLSALTGVVFGVSQIIVGLFKTPAYLEAVWSGKHWDPIKKQWIRYSLQQEVEELLSTTISSRRVQDMSYYHLLGVPANATSREIKRAYYQKARDIHPDKNPDDQEAAAKFLQIHNAYQTLSDHEKRGAYDEWGLPKQSSSDADLSPLGNFRPDIFFAILFGSQLVEPYVGQLTVATFVGQLINLSRSGTITVETLSLLRDESIYKRRKRQVEIASNMLNRIDPFISGNISVDEFRMSCREEGNKIAVAGGFGRTFLNLIGTNLHLQARIFMDLHQSALRWPSGILSLVKRKRRGIENSVRSTLKTVELIRDFIHAAMQSAEEGKKQISTEKLEQMLPQILKVAWAHNVQDIARTLEGACQKLFDDSDTNSLNERIQRAQAVQILSEEFILAATGDQCEDNDMNANNVKARLSVAFRLALMEVRFCCVDGMPRCDLHFPCLFLV